MPWPMPWSMPWSMPFPAGESSVACDIEVPSSLLGHGREWRRIKLTGCRAAVCPSHSLSRESSMHYSQAQPVAAGRSLAAEPHPVDECGARHLGELRIPHRRPEALDRVFSRFFFVFFYQRKLLFLFV